VNEEARRLKMRVAGEIEIVDTGAFENGRMLGSDVGRKQQQPIVRMVRGQFRPATIQLLDDDSDILVTEMPLLLYEIPKRSVRSLPSDNPVEATQGPTGCAELDLRQPPLKGRPVRDEIAHNSRLSHVRYNIMFINNEQ
jgi:hypothetical protein